MKLHRFGIILTLLGCLVLMTNSANAESKAVFGVKPGILVQSSYFGIDAKRWHPFAGIDLVAIAISEDNFDASASVWIPHFGTKLYLQDPWQAGKVAPYLQGDYFFSIASVKVDALESAEEEAVKEGLEFWGLGLAFGMEYYFSDHFAVGGEYGIRFLQDKVSEHSQTYDYGDGYTYEDKVNDEFSIAFRMNYAAISANFHF